MVYYVLKLFHGYINSKKFVDICLFHPGTYDHTSDINLERGNWFSVVPDQRLFSELKQLSYIEGMIMLEGGNKMVNIPGYCLFETKEDDLLHFSDEKYYI